MSASYSQIVQRERRREGGGLRQGRERGRESEREKQK